MNIQVGRDQRVDSLGPLAARLSEQVAYNLAPVLEVLGIASLQLRRDDTMVGSECAVSDVDYFQDVPSGILKWAEPASHAIGRVMAAFGLMSMSMDVEEQDLDKLRKVWSDIAGVAESSASTVKGWGMDTDPSVSDSVKVDTGANENAVEDNPRPAEVATGPAPVSADGESEVIVL